jgi:hypothetical protein
MNVKSLLAVGALTLSFGLVASAKSYDIVLSSPAKAGSVVLPAGQYSLKLNGANAVFKNNNSSKQFTAPVKVESASRKHEETAVDMTKQNGTDQILSIELGGSKTTLEFNN